MATIEEQCRQLAGLIGRTRDADELTTLLNGLLAPQEVEEVVLRWRLIEKLIEGCTQRDISEQLGVSLGKIARGSRLLKYGSPEFHRLARRLLREEREEPS